MLKPKSMHEFWLDGKKYSLFVGTFKDLPKDIDEVDEFIDDFELEVDNNFWNNGLKKQKQYIEHLHTDYLHTYAWYETYEEKIQMAYDWCIEYAQLLVEKVEENPDFFRDANYTMAWKKIGEVQDIHRNYSTAKEILNRCRGIAEKYSIKITKTHLDNAIMSQRALIGQAPESTEPGVKLQWNGAANTLYDVFRQLKNHHLPDGSVLIEDSYDKIALFIQQSFTDFDTVATSTIRGKLTKNARPNKAFNRADLDLSEPD